MGRLDGAGRGRAGAGGRRPALVAGLSAPRRADRERAAKRLEALGEAARPALLEAAESNDLELRARAAAVLDAIEGRAIGRPTPVTLDFRDVPLAEVVDLVSERSGLGLVLEPGSDPSARPAQGHGRRRGARAVLGGRRADRQGGRRPARLRRQWQRHRRLQSGDDRHAHRPRGDPAAARPAAHRQRGRARPRLRPPPAADRAIGAVPRRPDGPEPPPRPDPPRPRRPAPGVGRGPVRGQAPDRPRARPDDRPGGRGRGAGGRGRPRPDARPRRPLGRGGARPAGRIQRLRGPQQRRRLGRPPLPRPARDADPPAPGRPAGDGRRLEARPGLRVARRGAGQARPQGGRGADGPRGPARARGGQRPRRRALADPARGGRDGRLQRASPGR